MTQLYEALWNAVRICKRHPAYLAFREPLSELLLVLARLHGLNEEGPTDLALEIALKNVKVKKLDRLPVDWIMFAKAVMDPKWVGIDGERAMSRLEAGVNLAQRPASKVSSPVPDLGQLLLVARQAFAEVQAVQRGMTSRATRVQAIQNELLKQSSPPPAPPQVIPPAPPKGTPPAPPKGTPPAPPKGPVRPANPFPYVSLVPGNPPTFWLGGYGGGTTLLLNNSDWSIEVRWLVEDVSLWTNYKSEFKRVVKRKDQIIAIEPVLSYLSANTVTGQSRYQGKILTATWADS